MKIKTFTFKVWNSGYQDMAKERISDDEIDTTINDFIKGKNILNIKINNIDANYHNNGYENTILLKYTIMYN